MADSAEAFSSVLYLRGPDPRIFELTGRQLRPPQARTAPRMDAGSSSGPLAKIAGSPFSLILGGAWEDSSLREIHVRLRDSLVAGLQTLGEAIEPSLPLYSLAQRFSLVAGALKLGRLFQKVLVSAYQHGEQPASIDAVAALLRPGVHTTLLWLPLLEHALMRHHPDRAIYVIQPGPPAGEEHRLVMFRAPGQDDWIELYGLPRLRLEESFVVLRLYGGYSPEAVPVLTNPQLTEDDHIQGLFDLRYIVPPEWESAIMGGLRTRPVLCMGVSAIDWRHRMLLRWLFDQRPPPAGSLAILGETQKEEVIWETRGAGLPGTSSFTAVRASIEALIEAIREARP